MYSASDWTARARRRASTGAMASSHLTPVGRGVDMLHLPFCRTLRVFPETRQGQTAGRETRSGDFAARSRSGCVFQLRIVVTDLATASDCPHPLSDNGGDAVADSRGGYGREEEKRAPTETNRTRSTASPSGNGCKSPPSRATTPITAPKLLKSGPRRFAGAEGTTDDARPVRCMRPSVPTWRRQHVLGERVRGRVVTGRPDPQRPTGSSSSAPGGCPSSATRCDRHPDRP